MSSLIGYSQKGKVTDSNGEPLPGVMVNAPSYNLTVYVDFDGNYEIDVPEGTELIFSLVSYETNTVVSKENLDTVLEDIKLF